MNRLLPPSSQAGSPRRYPTLLRGLLQPLRTWGARWLVLVVVSLSSSCWWGREPPVGLPSSAADLERPSSATTNQSNAPASTDSCASTVDVEAGLGIPLCASDEREGESTAGQDGYTTLNLIDDDVGEECDGFGNGGQRIRSGLDNGDGDGVARNGELEEGEVDHTTIICNGADGAPGRGGDAGPAGADGISCTAFRDEEVGQTTIECADGTRVTVWDGEDGQPGERGPQGDAGPAGPPGVDGTSCTAIRNEAAGYTSIECEDGKSAIVYDGIDGADGLTGERGPRGDAGPQGEVGPQGLPGVDGSSCSTTRDDDAGVTTIECEDGASAIVHDGADGERGMRGDAGPQGEAGPAYRFQMIPFSSGNEGTCPDGGVWVQGGIDQNGNDTLDISEVTENAFICNGSDGADGAEGATSARSLFRVDTLDPGDTCANGGVRIASGMDENANDQLDDDEIIDDATLCEGGTDGGGVVVDPILSRDVILYDQGDIEALAGVVEIVGDVVVRGSLLTDFSGLSSLERVHGNVVVQDNATLTSFAGLSALREIDGNLLIRGLDALVGLNGLAALERVGGNLEIAALALLTGLNGLDALLEIGGNVSFTGIPQLNDFIGLQSLERIDGELHLVHMATLSSFDGFEALESIGRGIYIRDCPLLARTTLEEWHSSFVDSENVDAFGLGDAYEPEDRPNAPDLFGDYSSRTLTTGDVDWFRFTLQTRNRFSVKSTVQSETVEQEAVLQIQVLDDADRLIRTLSPFSPPDRLGEIPYEAGVVLEPGNYFLRIEAAPSVHPAGVHAVYSLQPKLVPAGAGAVQIDLHAPPLAIAGQGYAPVQHGVLFAEEQYLVRWRTMSERVRRDTLRRFGLSDLGAIGPLHFIATHAHTKHSPRVRSGTPAAERTLALLRKLRDELAFDLVEPNYFRFATAVVPNDARYAEQWHYPAISLPDAWELTTGSNAVRVAVLDTGLINHPDFSCGRLLPGFDFVDEDSSPVDTSVISGRTSHGTHVMGTIGACSNDSAGSGPESGVAGVDWNARLMPIRVLDDNGGGSDATILKGILWSVGLYNPNGIPANPNPVDVLNLSLGGTATSTSFQPILDAVYQTGAIVVVAAGNDATDALLYTPANATGVITVAAHGPDGRLSSYSNFGASIEIMAPGGQLVSSNGVYNEANGVLSTNVAYDGTPTFAFSQGTSMAAPHVAGVIALMKAVFPALDRQTALRILQESADPITTDDCPQACGAGRLNAFGAVAAAKSLGDGLTNRGPVIVATAHEIKLYNATSATLRLRNLGDAEGTVQLFADNGSGTAQVALTGPAQLPASAAADYTLNLTYGDLLDGRYSKWVAVSDASGTMLDRIRVVFERNDAGERIPGQSTRVSLLRQTGAQSYRWERVLDSGIGETSFSYMESPDEARFEALPTGTYIVLAEADVDGDGAFDGASVGENMTTFRKFEVDGYGVTRVNEVVSQVVAIELVMLRPFPDFALEMLEPHDVLPP